MSRATLDQEITEILGLTRGFAGQSPPSQGPMSRATLLEKMPSIHDPT
jgi:hypothetical protein